MINSLQNGRWEKREFSVWEGYESMLPQIYKNIGELNKYKGKDFVKKC